VNLEHLQNIEYQRHKQKATNHSHFIYLCRETSCRSFLTVSPLSTGMPASAIANAPARFGVLK